MRTYYIFRVNKSLNSIYEKNSISIYKMLNKINNMDKKEYDFAKRIYKKTVLPINKNLIDKYILMIHMNDIYYKKYGNIHILHSGKEESKLYLYNTYIKIITTNNISSFFKDIYSINNNMFCVDFENKDYFYLDDFEVKLLAS